jgi:glycosyltransferase involved in cell wall biosynthesis
MTELLLDQLAAGECPAWLHTIHLDTTVSSNQLEREQFRLRKLLPLFRQFRRSVLYAARGFHAYYPVSQNTIGLIRDAVILVPYKLTRRTIILHLHGGRLHEVLAGQPRVLRWIVRNILGGRRTRGIVLAESLRQCFSDLAGTQFVYVVPNGIALPPDLPAAQSVTYDHKLRVLFLSTVTWHKGCRELAAAVATLFDRGIPIELEIAGEPYTEEDRDWLNRSLSHPSVTWAGHLEGELKWEALARADVLALPSVVAEGQPLAILEGMASGCAILTTERGGMPQTVSRTEGVVLPAVHGSSLQQAIMMTLAGWAAEPETVRRLGAAARDRWSAEYTPARFFEHWLSAVTSALASEPPH